MKTAVAQLAAARNQVDVANLGVRLASEEVRRRATVSRPAWPTISKSLPAQDALARANDNQIVALYRYNQARADLAHATGQMEPLRQVRQSLWKR